MTQKQNMKKAFTLMELMVVIIILGLLASFVLPSITGKSEEAKEKVVCIQMKNIATALKMYKIDTSTYPNTSEGLKPLQEKYFEDAKLPKDSWSQPFIYIYSNDTFDIISYGPNKKEGGNDDIFYSKCLEK